MTKTKPMPYHTRYKKYKKTNRAKKKVLHFDDFGLIIDPFRAPQQSSLYTKSK